MNTVKTKIIRTISMIVLIANVMVFTSCNNKTNQEINNTVISTETSQNTSAAISEQTVACETNTETTTDSSATESISSIDTNSNDVSIIKTSKSAANIKADRKATNTTVNTVTSSEEDYSRGDMCEREFQYIRIINIDDNAKYFKKGEKIKIDLNVGWQEGTLDGCTAAEVRCWETGITPTDNFSKFESYVIKNFSDSSYKFKYGKKPSKKITITIDRPCDVGYGTIQMSLYTLKNITDAGTDNAFGYSNSDIIYYVADEFGNIIIAHDEPTKVNGESLASYKLLAKGDPLKIYSRKKLLDEGKITQKQYDRELFLMTRNYEVYSYDIMDEISGYKNNIDLDDNGTDETISFNETIGNYGKGYKMNISLKASDGEKSSVCINYLRKVRIYENHCISNQLYAKSFNYYSVSAETKNGEFKTWLIGYKDGKLICSKPYNGIYKGVIDYLIKISDVENDNMETESDCHLFFINNDMSLTDFNNGNFKSQLHMFDLYKVE